MGGRWTAGQPVPFELLADTFEAISETSKRLDIVNLLVRGRGGRSGVRASILLEGGVHLSFGLLKLWLSEGRRVGDLPPSPLSRGPPLTFNPALQTTPPLHADQLLPGHPLAFSPLSPAFILALPHLCLQINCFRAILATTPEDLLPAVYLCTNRWVGGGGGEARGMEHGDCVDPSSQSATPSSRVAPAHHGIELGIGEGILFKVRGLRC